MKPTRNQFFCIDCGKNKMRFSSDKKAMNFIKFNADEIEKETGKRLERCYYCVPCGAWHVTSWKAFTIPQSKTERIVEQFRAETGQKAMKMSMDLAQEAQEMRAIITSLERMIAILERYRNPRSSRYEDLLEKAFTQWERLNNSPTGKRKVKRRLKHQLDNLKMGLSIFEGTEPTDADETLTKKEKRKEKVQVIDALMHKIAAKVYTATMKKRTCDPGWTDLVNDATSLLGELDTRLADLETFLRAEFLESQVKPMLSGKLWRRKMIEKNLKEVQS